MIVHPSVSKVPLSQQRQFSGLFNEEYIGFQIIAKGEASICNEYVWSFLRYMIILKYKMKIIIVKSVLIELIIVIQVFNAMGISLFPKFIR